VLQTHSQNIFENLNILKARQKFSGRILVYISINDFNGMAISGACEENSLIDQRTLHSASETSPSLKASSNYRESVLGLFYKLIGIR
jgi:hypothetical protein